MVELGGLLVCCFGSAGLGTQDNCSAPGAYTLTQIVGRFKSAIAGSKLFACSCVFLNATPFN
jgi:hypothetical protein